MKIFDNKEIDNLYIRNNIVFIIIIMSVVVNSGKGITNAYIVFDDGTAIVPVQHEVRCDVEYMFFAHPSFSDLGFIGNCSKLAAVGYI
jgi:hypothetical protein